MANHHPESGSKHETERAQEIANKFYERGDKVDTEKEPEIRGLFNEAGTETAQGNYDKAQRLLESSAMWDDELRDVASEVNKLEQERREVEPMPFENAKERIMDYAKGFKEEYKETGMKEEFEGAMEIESIIRGTERPGEDGVEGIDGALNYIEGVLQTRVTAPGEMTQEKIQDIEEKRAIRDALYQEKQKRIEDMQKSRQASSELKQRKNFIQGNIERLYVEAGVLEETPSRQAFLRRIQGMSPEELRSLHTETQNIAGEFGRTRDTKSLDAALLELSLKDFTKEGVEKAQKIKDEEELKKVREELDIKPDRDKKYEIPEKTELLWHYSKEHFGRFQQLNLKDFKEQFGKEDFDHFRQYIQQLIRAAIKDKEEEGQKSNLPDRVKRFLEDTSLDILQRIISSKEGRVIDQLDIQPMSLEEVAKKYLDLDVKNIDENYSRHFHPHHRRS